MIKGNVLAQNRRNSLPCTVRTSIKGLVVAIVGMLLPEDLPNGLALRCYQPSRPLRYEASPDFESNYIYIVIHIWIEIFFVFEGNSGES